VREIAKEAADDHRADRCKGVTDALSEGRSLQAIRCRPGSRRARMADLKPQVYKDPRPAEYFTRFHERGRSRRPDWVYEVVRILLTPVALLLYRTRAIGTENVPAIGPVILTPNHFSQMDHFFAAVYLRRKVRFMAKSQLFKPPFLTFILSHGGVFPIRRGHHDEEAFITAHAILEDDGCLLMYAEGGRSRSGGLGQPRPGVGRIALESGVPVVPVALHGSAGVRGWKRLRFPKVTVQYGEPLSFPVEASAARERQQEVANEVFDRVRTMYVRLEESGRRGVIRALRKGLAAPEPGKATPEP
jgi:1-acyl-sn-glycerol-3-phosphate acyltransferase